MGARGFCWRSAGGARLRFGVGRGVLLAVGGRARCRVHSQHPGPPVGGCCRFLFWWGVCWVRPFCRDPSFIGGLWWLWWVVCDLYSGCEHLCCLRASPLLFCCSSCVRAWGVGGRVARGPAAVVVVGLWVCFLLCGFVGRSVDALAPRADEGRCGLRYASGSWRASVDPRVSEWGNLTRVVLGYHHLNVYRVVGGTRGSETSQYP